MQYNYCFIGVFEVESDTLLIQDPLSQERKNDIMIKCEQGIWYAYHICDGITPVGLLSVTKGIQPERIALETLNFAGEVDTTYGRILTLIDKSKLGDFSHTYYGMDNTSYRITDLLEWVDTWNNEKTKELKNFLQMHATQTEFIEYELIKPYLGITYPPVTSELWGVECAERARHNMDFCAAPIYGGVVTEAPAKQLTCYTDSTPDHRIVYVPLS